MISDNERREVARKIRETGEELGSSALLWYHIAKALGVRTATDGKTACGMLADLIEPSGHECVPGECPLNIRHDNDRIDRDALLELADGLDKDADNIISAARNAQFTGSGPRMEEAKHDAYDWRQISIRIRDALGVEHG